MSKTAIIALGGNALSQKKQAGTIAEQFNNTRHSFEQIMEFLRRDYNICLTHGNGPQVGLLSLQSAAYKEVDEYPLDILGAQTQGMIGYMIEQELGNLLPIGVPIASILTMVEVDPEDPAFLNPTKPSKPKPPQMALQRSGPNFTELPIAWPNKI